MPVSVSEEITVGNCCMKLCMFCCLTLSSDLHGKTPVDLALTSDMKEALNVPVTIIDTLVPSSQVSHVENKQRYNTIQ